MIRALRVALPEGMMGGSYARPDEDMQVIWDAGVAEVREVIETGWVASARRDRRHSS
jgi:creatinine amidohydrolase